MSFNNEYIIGSQISGTTISGGTIYSGFTNLGELFIFSGKNIGSSTQIFSAKTNGELLFKSISAGTNVSLIESNGNIAISSSVQSTTINNGINTFTAGTPTFQSVNVTALTINTLTASGNSVFIGTLSGGSQFSAGTINSGTTNLYNIFSQLGHTHEFSTILNTAHTHSISDVSNLQGSLNTKVNKSGDTMTGGLITTSLSATTLSGGTIYSGNTNLTDLFAISGVSLGGASIFTGKTNGVLQFKGLSAGTNVSLSTDGNVIMITSSDSQTLVQPGTNTYTGGTSSLPTVNVSALTINTLAASGNSVFSGTLSGGSQFSAGTIYSGSTNLYNIFSQLGHTHEFSTILNTAHTHTIADISNLQGSLNTKVNKSGDTMTGGLITTSLSATTLSGGTIYSGNTNLTDLFTISGVSLGGASIFTGKTNGILQFKGLSAGTNISLTSANDVIMITASGSGGVWAIGTGSNSIYAINPTLNPNSVLSKYSIVAGNGNQISHATSYYSAIINGKGHNISRASKYSFIGAGFSSSMSYSKAGSIVSGGNNTLDGTGGLLSDYSSLLAGASNILRNFKYSTILVGNQNKLIGTTQESHSAIISGRKNYLYGSYASIVTGKFNVSNDKTSFIGTGSGNTIDNGGAGGYGYNSIINGVSNEISRTDYAAILNGFANKITVGGQYSAIIAGKQNTLSGKRSVILGGSGYTLSANDTVLVPKLRIANLPSVAATYTLVADSSGNVYKTIAGTTPTLVQPGTNTYTGGTASLPTVNVSALTINTLTASGNSIFSGTLSGGSQFSANTIFSGSTNLSNLFAISGVSLGGAAIFTGKTNGILQFKGLSAGTNVSLSTDGNVIMITASVPGGSQTYVQPGLNTYTGGTSTAPTINISGGTFDNLNVTGTSFMLSSTTAYTQYLKVNTLSSTTANPERVFIYDGVINNNHSNILAGYASASTYAQLNVRNLHPGVGASSDVVATANNGDESTNYVDMGINSSSFAGYLGGTNDAYLYTTGNHLWLGTVTSNKRIYMITDGTGTTNSRFTITSAYTESTVPLSANSTVLLNTAQTRTLTSSAFTMNNLTVDMATGRMYRRSGHTLNFSWGGSIAAGTTPGIIWTNQPANKTTWLHQTDTTLTGDATLIADLNGMTECRLFTSMQVAASSANATLVVDLSTDNTNWATIVTLTIGNSTGAKDSGWVRIPFSAQTFVYMRLAGTGGNGVVDPRFSPPTILFR